MSLVGLVDLGGGLNLGGNPAVCQADLYSAADLTLGVPLPICGAGASTPCGCGCSSGTAASLDAGGQGGGCGSNRSGAAWLDGGNQDSSRFQTGGGGSALPLLLDWSALSGARPLPGYLCPLPPNVAAQQVPVSPLPGIAPVPVPGSGASYSQGVLCQDSNHIPVSGLLIRCTETGVTLGSACSLVTFHTNTNTTQHYTSLQGPGTNCNTQAVQTYGSGTGSNAPANNVEIPVSVV